MKELADYCNGSVSMGVRDRLNMVYVESCRSGNGITTLPDIGTSVPISHSVIGRAFLAACTPPEREAVLNHMKVKEPEAHRKYRAPIDKSLEDIRARGFCASTGELRREVHAVGQGEEIAQRLARERHEYFIRTAAMPTAANPFRWLCVAETDTAMYRFSLRSDSDGVKSCLVSAVDRFEKPAGRNTQLVASASRDPRAQILLGFARFPIEKVEDSNCLEQTLVHFADLRYTEPGGPARGNFALDVPVECDTR